MFTRADYQKTLGSKCPFRPLPIWSHCPITAGGHKEGAGELGLGETKDDITGMILAVHGSLVVWQAVVVLPHTVCKAKFKVQRFIFYIS